ncbi:MAG: M16 family metallopeptidase [Phycisphaerae bacterium]
MSTDAFARLGRSVSVNLPVLLFGVLVAVFSFGCATSGAAEADSRQQSTPTTQTVKPEPAGAETQPQPPAVVERMDTGDDVTVVTLENGLTVILQSVRTSPVVCVRGYVRAGGLYEGEWLGCGVSHLLEHLVADEAEHDSPDGGGAATETREPVDRVRRIGAQANAYTTLDHTCYYISATAAKTDQCIELLADWLARAEITEDAFRREHGVVQRELEMRYDDPDRQLWQAHMENLYRQHPAAVPVIGYERPLRELTIDDVREYHRRMYVPQNMVVSIVGDIDVSEALRQVQKQFAGASAGRQPDLTLPDVQPIAGERRVVRTHAELTEAQQTMSFLTIPLIHDDLYALDVLSFVLTRGEASLLERTIRREKQLVTSVDSFSWTPAWGKGPFSIDFRTQPEKADAAEQAILDELARIREEGVSQDELDRAKRQKVADYVRSLQTVESISATLAGDYLSTGETDFSRRYTDRIQQVTAEQVRDVARKYLDPQRMVVTRMLPADPAAELDADTADRQTRAGEPRMFTLDNGMRVVLGPNPAVGLVSMTFVSAGGVLLEDESTNGFGTLMTNLTTKGTADRTAEDIAEFFDAAGGELDAQCGNNTFYWQASVLESEFSEAVAVLADVVQHPTFPEEELEILRPRAIAASRQIDENVLAEGQKFFRGSFFEDSPYRLLSPGRQEVLAEATAEKLADWHEQHVKAGSSVLAVYGNFDADEARELITGLFADLPEGEVSLPNVSGPDVPQEDRTFVKETEKQVSAVVVGAAGMVFTNIEDRAAIDVLDTIISGYRLPSGWLHEELRGRELVYVVHAYNWPGLLPGAFMTYAVCQPSEAQEVAETIRRNLRRASQYKPTPQEVEEAVNIILTAELLGKQSMDALSMNAALNELYGLGYDFHSRLQEVYRDVTPEDVLRAGEKYLGGGYTTVITTPAPEDVEP